jgi:hypothetical protein
MKILVRFGLILSLAVALSPTYVAAQNATYYILQSRNLVDAQLACETYGFSMVSTVHAPDTFLVAASPIYTLDQLKAWTKGDPNVKNIDVDHQFVVPESTQLATVTAPTLPLTTYITDPNLIKLYGPNVWAAYVEQPAFYSTNAYLITGQLQSLSQLSPAGTAPGPGKGNAEKVGNHPLVIAVIDTGIDNLNPVLAPYVVSGYDFTRNVAGFASDIADLNQSTAAILEQSTAGNLEQYQVAVLNQSTSAILEQSTAAILESDGGLPAYFGHGTMAAGLIHLVAPNSQLMPLKAFAADGTGSEANIIQAIYYAVHHGANVINMSFEVPQITDAMMKAINYAARNGVICVASAGNDAATTLVYPAAFGNVISVASVNLLDQQSTFSNFGPDLVQIAAPGEGLITTYPGKHYAQVWGTSFSAALVSGAVSVLMQQTNPNITTQLKVGDVQRAFSHAGACGTNGSLGAGCLDLNQAAGFIKGMNMPPPASTLPNN